MNVQRLLCAFVVIVISLFLSYPLIMGHDQYRCQIRLINDGYHSLLPNSLVHFVNRADCL